MDTLELFDIGAEISDEAPKTEESGEQGVVGIEIFESIGELDGVTPVCRSTMRVR